MLKVAIVGCGKIADAHARDPERSRDVKLSVCVTVSRLMAKQL